MKIEIDQSGKIEDTAKHTILADSIGHCVRINAKDKQFIQQLYRVIHRPQIFVYDTFAVLTALLIRESYTRQHIYVIDREYFGNEQVLKGLIHKYLRSCNIDVLNHQIAFDQIGKKSVAHKNAYLHFKARKGDEVCITREEILKVLIL